MQQARGGGDVGHGLLFENFHVHILSTFDIEINEVWHVAPHEKNR